MIETAVDLAYRGLPFARRVPLSGVRPTTCVLEVAAPMPVGTQLVLAAEDGTSITATVTWVHEPVTGAERPPGMVVAPELADPAIAAWWAARVQLPEQEATPARARSRPVTVRPRSQTRPTVQPDGSTTDEMPTIIADLDARVAAAAGIGAAASAATASGPAVNEAAVSEAAVSGAAAIAPAPIDPGASSRAAAITPAPIDPGAASGATTSDVAPDAASLAPVTSGVTGELAEPVDLVPRRAIRTTADHDVIDDGRHTILMATVVAPDEDDEVEITVTQAALEVEDTQDDSGDEPGAAEGEPRPDGPDGGRRRRRRR